MHKKKSELAEKGPVPAKLQAGKWTGCRSSEEFVAIKHTGAVHMAGTLTLLQRKAANVLLKYAYKDLAFQETHRVKLSEIARDLGWAATTHTNEKLKDAIRKLNITQVEWNILGKDNRHEWGVATVLAEAIIRDGYCTYAYSPTMRKLQANPTLYARLDLVVQQSFDRVYTLALWEFLTEALCSGRNCEVRTAWIALEDFRRLMGANTRYYQNFSKFNSKVMQPALEEVNEKSDIHVKLLTRCSGRTVEALAFVANRKFVPDLEEEKKKAIAYMPEESTSDSFKQLARVLEQEFGFSASGAQKLVVDLAGLSDEAMHAALAHIRKRRDAGEIKNLCAYTATALKGEYGEKEPQKSAALPGYGEDEPTDHPGWNVVRARIKESIGEAGYYHWIRDLQLVGIESGNVTLMAKSAFIKDWVVRYYEEMLLRFWKEQDASVNDILFQVAPPLPKTTAYTLSRSKRN